MTTAQLIPSRGRSSRRHGLLSLPLAAALVVGVAGCGTGPGTASPAVTADASPSTLVPGSPGRSAAARPPLPSGFPVMDGADVRESPADDPSIIAVWQVAEVGSGPYDHYLEALPAAGYPIVGRYPSETSALIRFSATGGEVWQLVIEAADGGTRITLRTDRP